MKGCCTCLPTVMKHYSSMHGTMILPLNSEETLDFTMIYNDIYYRTFVLFYLISHLMLLESILKYFDKYRNTEIRYRLL